MNANTIVDEMPAGYRLATSTEVQRHMHPAYYSRMVQVRYSFPGVPETFTDLAIIDDDTEGGATVLALPKRPTPGLLTSV